MNEQIKFLSFGGYGGSGGTVVRDLLREFDFACEIGKEFRLIKDPYGIIDLEMQLCTNWRVPLNADIAIKDFLWLTKNLGRTNKRLGKKGFGYQDVITPEFIDITNEYVKNISEFEYTGKWHLLKFKESYVKQITQKIRRKVKIGEQQEIMYYAKPSKQKFIDETRNYLKSLFQELCEREGKSTVMLHNAIPTYNPNQSLEYFESIKMVIVDRDPRDIYMQSVINKKSTNFMGAKLAEDRDVKVFCDDFLKRRENQQDVINDNRILLIKFEDLIFNYDRTLEKVMDFLSLEESQHINPKKLFDPEVSKNNVGLWKDHDSPEEIDYIYKKLKKYCYEG